MSDDEVEELCLLAGMTSEEVDRCRVAFPEIGSTMDIINQVIAERLAREIIKRLFPRCDTISAS